MIEQDSPRERPIRRDTLVSAITGFLANQEPPILHRIRASLEQELDEAGPGALAALRTRLAKTGADWCYYPADPLARRIHHVIADNILPADSTLVGIEHVEALGDRPVVIFANHLSYSDANLLEILLRRAGSAGAALADRLTVIAGPKVYSSLQRRFSSLCFGTVRTPQSSGLSTGDAVMNARDVAQAARRSIEMAHERLRHGDALLVFGEGRRSRSHGLQQMLTGAARYLDHAGICVLPVAITGTEAMFPIDDNALYRIRIVARVGAPMSGDLLRAHADQNRRVMMDAVALAVAALLPEPYRGEYREGMEGLDEATRVLEQLGR